MLRRWLSRRPIAGLGSIVVIVVGTMMLTAALGVGGASRRPLPVLDAAAGGEARDGDCFATAEYSIALPNPDVLAKAITASGYGRRLPDGGYAVRADALPTAVGGELVGAAQAYRLTVSVVHDGDTSVASYVRVDSSKGDQVWYLESSTSQVACEESSRQ